MIKFSISNIKIHLLNSLKGEEYQLNIYIFNNFQNVLLGYDGNLFAGEVFGKLMRDISLQSFVPINSILETQFLNLGITAKQN